MTETCRSRLKSRTAAVAAGWQWRTERASLGGGGSAAAAAALLGVAPHQAQEKRQGGAGAAGRPPCEFNAGMGQLTLAAWSVLKHQLLGRSWDALSTCEHTHDAIHLNEAGGAILLELLTPILAPLAAPPSAEASLGAPLLGRNWALPPNSKTNSRRHKPPPRGIGACSGLIFTRFKIPGTNDGRY